MTNDDYADQYDDLDDKNILIGILTELQQIRLRLEAGERDDTPPTYRCDRCDATVPKDGRVAHARDAHKAPPSEAERIFTPVE